MMMPFQRCAVLLSLVALAARPALSGGTGGAGTPTVSREAALDNIAKTVLLPGYRELAARSRDLETAAEALISTPSGPSLERTQRAWRAVLLAWRRAQAFAHGPVADLGVYNRVQFWPSRRQSVDRVLRADRPFDATYIQELGANAVGLSALEVMLFDPRLDDQGRVAAFSGPQGARQRRYFQALVHELSAQTTRVEGAWQADYATRFKTGGQQQLNLLVNDLLAAIETGAQGRLQVVLDHRDEPQLRTDLVEGGLSGTSQEGVLALLQGAAAVFSGGDGAGVDDYLRQLNAPAARRVEAQFKKAVTAVQEIGDPLERAVTTRERTIARAQEECRALEILLKVEVASTLGVTLTFKSTDGD